MPCGNTNRPWPNPFRNVPDASNFKIGGKTEPSQTKGSPGLACDGRVKPFTPQRSATQTLEPSRSISTPPVAPQARPSGIVPQFAIVRYGLGAEFVGATLWASAAAAHTAASAAKPNTAKQRIRPGYGIAIPPAESRRLRAPLLLSAAKIAPFRRGPQQPRRAYRDAIKRRPAPHAREPGGRVSRCVPDRRAPTMEGRHAPSASLGGGSHHEYGSGVDGLVVGGAGPFAIPRRH